jgi:hypothetical protein
MYHFFVSYVFHRGCEDDYAVIVMQDQHVCVPTVRSCWEPSRKICVYFPGLHYGCINIPDFFILHHIRVRRWRRHLWLCGPFFCQILFMLPLTIASDMGMNLKTLPTVKFGHITKCPLAMTLIHVSCTGHNQHATGHKHHACKYVSVYWNAFVHRHCERCGDKLSGWG